MVLRSSPSGRRLPFTSSYDGLSLAGRPGSSPGESLPIRATGRRQVPTSGLLGTAVGWGQLGTILPGAPIYDVMASPFNAKGDGSDDQAALNAAIAAANATSGAILLGPNTHGVAGPLTPITGECVSIIGRGQRNRGSRILALGSTPFDILTFRLSRACGVYNTVIAGPGTWASPGRAIVIDDAFITRVVDCQLSSTYGAADIFSSVTTEFIRTYASAILGPVGFYAHGSDAAGENHALTFQHCATGSDASGGTIAWWKQGSYCHTLELISSGALEGGHGLIVEDDSPGDGSEPKFTHCLNFKVDHPAISGIELRGGAAARMTTCFITSVGGGPGLWVKSTYGGNWELLGGEVSGITGHGLLIEKGHGTVTSVQIGSIIAGSDCIHVAPGVTDLTLNGNTCGDIYSKPSNARWGINIGAGCDRFIVVNNRCIGNETGAINNPSGTSATRVVANNIPSNG